MKTRRFTIGIASAVGALAFAVPLAGAGNTIVDDYWRDQAPVTSQAPDTIVDDYFRDAPQVQSPAPNTIVDDYFRDPPVAVVTVKQGFDWADFGIGIAVAVGAMLVLAGVGAGLLAFRQGRGHHPRPTG
jgi:hypothetical protein